MHPKFKISHFSCLQHKTLSDPHNFKCNLCRIQTTIKQIPRSIVLIFTPSQPILSLKYPCWEYSLDLGGACNQSPQQLLLRNMKKNHKKFSLMRIWVKEKKKNKQFLEISQLPKPGKLKLLKILHIRRDLP